MMKFLKKQSWFFVIALQSLIGIGAGFLILSSIKVNTVTANVRLGELSISGLLINQVETAVSNYYADIVKNGALTVEVDKKPFKLAYSAFDASVDMDKTLDAIKKLVPQNGFDEYFYGAEKDSVIEPVFSYNSGKLIALLEKIFSPYEKNEIPEHYEAEQGVLKLIPQEPGRKVDYAFLEQNIKGRLFALSKDAYVIDTKSPDLFKATKSESRYKEKFTTLITKVAIPLEPGLEEKVKASLEPLQGAFFEKGQEINLGSLLDFSKFSSEMDKDLLNRISTALYQAALPIEKIKVVHRKPSQRAVSYTEPGLEAVIEGESANLILKNETDRTLMLLANAAENTLTFYIASTGEVQSGILVVQKKDPTPPPVITSVNSQMSPKETEIVSEGIPGYTVTVSRIIDDDRVELYQDKYQPVSKIVETGEKPLLTSDK